MGEKEFGMSKSFIYQVISTCTKCTSEDLKQELDSNVIFDPDIFNESRNFDLNEAPLTMAWGRPPPGSIWFNQKGTSYVNVREILFKCIPQVLFKCPDKT